ncbi:hypothetical protein [Paraburkholderia hayleyella]|uniref:hypothetical protein n=1 Tax=Paraburkholderia hayleyella TaxID=2152889 RepID=UPI0012927876|nr:hypothetical protein [Paraburkholderia hayleyella]
MAVAAVAFDRELERCRTQSIADLAEKRTTLMPLGAWIPWESVVGQRHSGTTRGSQCMGALHDDGTPAKNGQGDTKMPQNAIDIVDAENSECGKSRHHARNPAIWIVETCWLQYRSRVRRRSRIPSLAFIPRCNVYCLIICFAARIFRMTWHWLPA